MFWVCSESYRGSGRLSRTWIIEGGGPPDAPEKCEGQYPACKNADRAPWAHEMSHIPYPFNGMGGAVEGVWFTRAAADEHEADLWSDS